MAFLQKRTQKQLRLALVLLFLCAAWLFFLQTYRETVAAFSDAFLFCRSVLIPSLFPFLFLTEWIVSSGIGDDLDAATGHVISRMFGISPAAACVFLLGSLSGFPIGARLAARYRQMGRCTKEEAENVTLYANNASPAFLISGIGSGMLHDVSLGVILYLSQVLASVILGLLLKKKRFSPPSQNAYSVGIVRYIGPAVAEASLSMVRLCGFVLLFSTVSGWVVKRIGGIPGAVLAGLIETVNGSRAVAALPFSFLTPILLSFLCSFSGMSVWMQVCSFYASTDLFAGRYLPARLLIGVLSSLVTLLLIFFTKGYGFFLKYPV